MKFSLLGCSVGLMIVLSAYPQQSSKSILIGGSARGKNGVENQGELGFFPSSLGEPAVYFTSSSVSIGEDMTAATLTVLRTGDSLDELTVDYRTVSGSAFGIVPGSTPAIDSLDFKPEEGTLHFAPLETTKTIVVPIYDNFVVNGPKTFRVTLSNASADAHLSVDSSTVTVGIFDNDRPGTVDFSFAPPEFRVATEDLFRPLAAIAVEADGKVLVSGVFTMTNPVTGLATSAFRLNQDGSFDTSFELTVPIRDILPGGGNAASIHVFVPQPDGRILVGCAHGLMQLNGRTRSGIARLTPDGSLDDSFNPTGNYQVRYIALQPDGRILVGGDSFRPVRLLPNGELDSAFTSKLGAVSPEQFPLGVTLIQLQPDGRILVVGESTRMGRLNPDGSLDRSFRFGSGPALVSAPGITPVIASMALQEDGKILVCGSFDSFNGFPCPNYARLNRDGLVDTNFPRSPAAATLYPPVFIALQPDGKILLAGGNLERLNPDGTIDQSFDWRDAPIGGTSVSICRVIIAPEGKMFVGGNFNPGREVSSYVVRLNADPLKFSGIVQRGTSSLALTLATVPGRNYVVERSSDLRTWLPLHTNVATGFMLEFEDSEAASFPHRFYRAVSF